MLEDEDDTILSSTLKDWVFISVFTSWEEIKIEFTEAFFWLLLASRAYRTQEKFNE